MTSRADQALESFKVLCNNILAGTVDNENMKAATKAMNDTGQSEKIRQEFNRIGEIMEKRKKK